MHSTDFIAAVRTSGQLPTADPTYTAAAILRLGSTVQQRLFERALVNSRDGYLLQQRLTATVAGTSVYRLPPRAVTQGAERVEMAGADGKYLPLTKLDPRNASLWESTGQGQPGAFTVRGDSVQLFPTPSAVYSLRIHYYLRPSALATAQLADTGTHRGLIVAHDATSLAVNAPPFDMLAAVPAVITVSTRVDVVRPDGGHDRVVVSARVATIAGPTLGIYTLGFVDGDDLSRVADGDYVRVAEQSDWPNLPPEFHQTLADATAATILLNKGSAQKAQQLASSVQSDLARFTDLLNPRVKDQPKVIKPRFGIVRGSRSWPRGPFG